MTPPSLAWDGGEEAATALLVAGAADRSGLAVVPAGALTAGGPLVPMAGRWEADGDALRFVPRLPFARGIAYVLVRPDVDGTGWIESARLRRPAAAVAPTTAIAAIHPDVEQVPQNLLRLAVTFSAAMEEGGAAGRVHLEDPAGRPIDQAMLPMPPELWDQPRRRLTLLLEPGRIKRGLVPNAALGAPLSTVTSFDLVVDETVRDAAGATLTAGARRTYRVGPPVRSRVDPARWRTSWPVPGSRDALVVDFERALDHTLALRCLVVTDEDGRAVPGRAALARGGVRWSFQPHDPWSAQGVRLRIDTALEDLAGNSVRRVFDRDLQLVEDDPVDAAEIVLTRPGTS